ncbi:MAG TPA: MBL fold metallo-hydrolase [Spirochaetota bacterium]|nr:MBL fold metallo-hydrolase [Spirochaetota bacterium]HPJ36264.1 MBL fold metallo-hydrolase [Spirochaetota bacterium]
MRIDRYKDIGLIAFAESVKEGRATNFSNTFILDYPGKKYIIDTSCGKKRFREIKDCIKGNTEYSILCTHYHNDHIANNGRLARKGSPIIYHENAGSKISYLRTNASGQILRMYRDMEKEGFLKRLGIFNDGIIRLFLKRKVYSRYIAEPLLFAASYILSLKSIGRIYSGKKHVKYLKKNARTELDFNGIKTEGWIIDEFLYALEAPGHTDCHTVFYNSEYKLLIAGDALNFLTPNDIQFGTLKETIVTQKFLLELVKKEKINILCQGHYPPIEGNDEIIRYISDIIEKHEHVFKLIWNYIKNKSSGLTFDELYNRICALDDPLIKRLTKITFPRSTLVFLDVYLLKMLENAGLKQGNYKTEGS